MGPFNHDSIDVKCLFLRHRVSSVIVRVPECRSFIVLVLDRVSDMRMEEVDTVSYVTGDFRTLIN